MNAVQRARASMPTDRDVLVAAALAVLASLSYVLIEVGILGVANVEKSAMGYAAARGYLLGGLLILLRRRWLWIVGAVINALVILFFFMAYASRPDVIWSPGGPVPKLTQVLLEALLLYLIVTATRRVRTPVP